MSLAVMCDNRFMKDPLDEAAAAALAAATATQGGRSAPNPNLAQLSAKVNETIPESLDDLQADQIPWNNPHWHPAHGGIYRNVRLHVARSAAHRAAALQFPADRRAVRVRDRRHR